MCKLFFGTPRVSQKWDGAILTHGNCKYYYDKKLAFWSKIEKRKQLFQAAGFGTSMGFHSLGQSPRQDKSTPQGRFLNVTLRVKYGIQSTLHAIIKPGGWNWEICPGGWIRLVWTTDPGGEIPSKSQIRLLERIVYTSRFSPWKPFFCNNHVYHFHVLELLNLIFGWPGGCQNKVRKLGPPRYNYDMQSSAFLCLLN